MPAKYEPIIEKMIPDALKIKVILAVLASITLVLLAYYGVSYYVLEQSNYFLEHFASALIMLAIGGCAILMPMLNSTKMTGENKGDNMMLVVGVLLFICSLVSIIISYM